ncbi:hypothetical protein Gotur_024087 [Gossypium turneri]
MVESGWSSNYSNNASERCQWPGISCNTAGSIIQIDISDAPNIEVGDRFGKLNFSSFPNLVLLDLSHRQLGAKIPHQIGNLSALKHLDLSRCGFSGELPLSLGNLTQLEYLDISYNDNINGSIPPQLGNLVNVVSLNFCRTNISGNIPLFLGLLTNLRHLLLDRYQFNDGNNTIPQTLWNLRGLVGIRTEIDKLSFCLVQQASMLAEQTIRFEQEEKKIYGKMESIFLNKIQFIHKKNNGSMPSTLG